MKPIVSVSLLAILAACAPTEGPDVTRFLEPSVIAATEIAPPPPDTTTCWGHVPDAEVTEIVRRTVIAEPAKTGPDGTEISPAIYRDMDVPETRPGGAGRWFERVCEADITEALASSLQRALAARGFFYGEITGLMDPATRDAVRAFQADQGLDSDLLSVAAGRQLGLIAHDIAPEVSEG